MRAGHGADVVYGRDLEDDWGIRRGYWKSAGFGVYASGVCAGKVDGEEVSEMRDASMKGGREGG